MNYRKDQSKVISYDSENSRTVLKTDYVVDSVIDQFIDRATFGRNKYGVGMERDDLSILEWIEHAKQEHMDAILYLEKLKVILGGRKK
jgi:hypothetical protein